jgi:formiminotetrahydrofolate cyclodeaminase
MEYLKRSLENYLEDLAAKIPAPGGGSASALAGAEGVALLAMVLNFTIGKKGYEEFQERAKEVLEKIEQIMARMSALIDEDISAYEKLDSVFKMPKNTEGEKSKRAGAMEAALKNAMGVPEEICRLVLAAAKFSPVILENGNVNLASDVGVGIELLAAAFMGARLNVEINLKSIKDAGFSRNVREKLDEWEKELLDLKKQVEEKLKRLIIV